MELTPPPVPSIIEGCSRLVDWQKHIPGRTLYLPTIINAEPGICTYYAVSAPFSRKHREERASGDFINPICGYYSGLLQSALWVREYLRLASFRVFVVSRFRSQMVPFSLSITFRVFISLSAIFSLSRPLSCCLRPSSSVVAAASTIGRSVLHFGTDTLQLVFPRTT
jgi:hypothetical protein